MYWCGDTQKGHLGFSVHPFLLTALLRSGLYSAMCMGTQNVEASPCSPSLGKIPESYSVTLWMASEGKGKSNKGLGVKDLEINLGCHQVSPCCISALTSGPMGMSKVPVSVRDRLSQTRKQKLQWKVCLHPHLKQRGPPPVGKKPWPWMLLFSLLQMGASCSKTIPLKCIKKKKCWDKFYPQNLKRHV